MLRDVIKSLSQEDRSTIMSHFDKCESFTLELEDGNMLGVHLGGADALPETFQVIEVYNDWILYRKKKNESQ